MKAMRSHTRVVRILAAIILFAALVALSHPDPGVSRTQATYVDATTLSANAATADAVGKPSVPQVTSTLNGVILSWKPSASPWIDGYQVLRATSASGPFSQVGTSAATTYTDTSASPGTTYYYRVQAYRSQWTAADAESSQNTIWTIPASSSVSGPSAMTTDAEGNIFIGTTNDRVYKVTSAGAIQPVAGTGSAGTPTEGSAAVTSQIGAVRALATDATGNLYIGDAGYAVYKVTLDGTIHRLAGTGTAGTPADGDTAASSSIGAVAAIATDPAGDVFIADGTHNRVYKVTTDGKIHYFAGDGTVSWTNGAVATATGLQGVKSVAADASGDVFIADSQNRVHKVTPDGTIHIFAGTGGYTVPSDGAVAASSTLLAPSALSTDGAGDVFIAGPYRVYEVTPDGIIHYFAGNGTKGTAVDGAAAKSSLVGNIDGLGTDASGDVFIGDTDAGIVYRVAPPGAPSGHILQPYIHLFAGTGTNGTPADGGLAASNPIGSSPALATDAAGDTYIADATNYRVYKVTPDGKVHLFAGTGTSGTPSNGAAAATSAIGACDGLATDAAGDVFIGDFTHYRVYKVTPDGVLHYFAGTGTNSTPTDGGTATSNAMGSPDGLAVDGAGDVFIEDYTHPRIYKVTPDGVLHYFAGNGASSGDSESGPSLSISIGGDKTLAADAAGDVFIGDSDNYQVWKATPDGNIAIFAGSGENGVPVDGATAATAPIDDVAGLAADAAGDVFIAADSKDRVYKVTPDGKIHIFAGNGTTSAPSDGAAAASSSVGKPYGLALDAAGDVLISDTVNFRVYKLTTG